MSSPLSFEVEIEQPVVNVEVSETVVDTLLVEGPPGVQGPIGPIGPTGATGPVGPSAQVQTDIVTGDNVTTSFLLSQVTTSDSSVQVFRNGLAEVIGIGFYVETAASTTAVTFSTAPLDTDVISVTYHV